MMKKISALLLALVMVLAIGATAFATGADMNGESGRIGEFNPADTVVEQTKTLKIYKEITAYNPETCTVNAPTFTYNYTIGAATVASGTTVTDNAVRHNKINGEDVTSTVAVKAGVGTPTITGTGAGVLAITPTDQLDASEFGTANRFPLTVDFSSVDWTTAGSGAGVYRYVITETTGLTQKSEAGIEDGNSAANDELFLDVYVDGSGKIYGYVLFKANSSIDGSTSEDTAASTVGKVEGFVDDADEHVYTSTDESTADKYYTFNFELTKEVVNDNYAESTHHQFPFHVTLDNADVTVAVLPKMTVGANATQTALTAAPIGTANAGNGSAPTVWTPTIADGAKITYVGIPCGTTVTVYETNDVLGVSYNSVSTNADTNAAAKMINTNVDSNNAEINCGADHLDPATENHTATDAGMLTFTNTLLQISPTGVVLRIAPYALILGAGVVLLLISHRRKAAGEED